MRKGIKGGNERNTLFNIGGASPRVRRFAVQRMRIIERRALLDRQTGETPRGAMRLLNVWGQIAIRRKRIIRVNDASPRHANESPR
jgi:hypothetical protein